MSRKRLIDCYEEEGEEGRNEAQRRERVLFVPGNDARASQRRDSRYLYKGSGLTSRQIGGQKASSWLELANEGSPEGQSTKFAGTIRARRGNVLSSRPPLPLSSLSIHNKRKDQKLYPRALIPHHVLPIQVLVDSPHRHSQRLPYSSLPRPHYLPLDVRSCVSPSSRRPHRLVQRRSSSLDELVGRGSLSCSRDVLVGSEEEEEGAGEVGRGGKAKEGSRGGGNWVAGEGGDDGDGTVVDEGTYMGVGGGGRSGKDKEKKDWKGDDVSSSSREAPAHQAVFVSPIPLSSISEFPFSVTSSSRTLQVLLALSKDEKPKRDRPNRS